MMNLSTLTSVRKFAFNFPVSLYHKNFTDQNTGKVSTNLLHFIAIQNPKNNQCQKILIRKIVSGIKCLYRFDKWLLTHVKLLVSKAKRQNFDSLYMAKRKR